MQLGSRLGLGLTRKTGLATRGWWTQVRLASSHTTTIAAAAKRKTKTCGSPRGSSERKGSRRGYVASFPNVGGAKKAAAPPIEERPQSSPRKGSPGKPRASPRAPFTTTTAKAEPPTSSSHSPSDASDVVDPKIATEARRKMAEDDVRLTMRMLMSRHFTQQHSIKLPQEMQQEEERRRLKMKLEGRMQRLEEKNRNAVRLLGAEAAAVGDGILPFFARPRSSHTPGTITGGSSNGGDSSAVCLAGATSGWSALNPVGLVGDADAVAASDNALGGLCAEDYNEVFRGSATVRLSALTQPNLSAYDTAHDVRIRSDSVTVPRESCSTPTGGDAGKGYTSAGALDAVDLLSAVEGSNAGGVNWTLASDEAAEAAAREALPRDSRSATSLLREEMLADDEDSDYAVRLYEDDDPDL